MTVVGALFVAAVPSSAEAANFLVPVGVNATSFGDFAENSGDDPNALRRAFGEPSSVSGSCVMRWSDVGVTAVLGTYGQEIDACDSGYFLKARLSDGRWQTTSGIHPGSSARLARRKAKGRRCGATCGPGVRGYVLGLHPSECATGLHPRVIAELRGRRVAALIVLTAGCE